MKLGEFLRKIVTSHSGTSSKRTCGVVGWAATILTFEKPDNFIKNPPP